MIEPRYFVVSDNRKAVRDPVTGIWLDWQRMLELVWQRCQGGKVGEQEEREKKLKEEEERRKKGGGSGTQQPVQPGGQPGGQPGQPGGPPEGEGPHGQTGQH